MDAEHPGEHRGGQFGGELEQCGGAGLTGEDAELAETFGHAEGADGPAGLAAGEQPGRGPGVADGGVALPDGGDLPCQRVERLGQDDGFAAQAQPYLVAVVLDVAEGEAADGRRPLGVEKDEQPGEPVFGVEGVVADQAAGLFPAASVSITPDGPPQRTAAKSSWVSLCRLAQRTKLPASVRWVACALASHASRSPCRAPSRVRSRVVSQPSTATAALMSRWAATTWSRVA